jgi:predicted site-specific integrase-resolvase
MTKPTYDLTVREAAAVLGVSITQVWRLIRSGELSAVVNQSVFRSERVTLLSRREVERRRVQRQGKSNG